MEKPVIVVVAFNKIKALKRLLKSLKKAIYPSNIKLIISIDYGGQPEVSKIADSFDWEFGEKFIIYQEKHQGLRNHILKCGDLTQEYGSIILLEDDLYVSPMFYEYSSKALEYYSDDESIAGISLYSQFNNIFTGFPFIPMVDESDVFFLQIPASWGEAWNQIQWVKFRDWYKNGGYKLNQESNIPRTVLNWPDSSWAKYFWMFMVEEKKYFVYPRFSLTTQFGEPGVHTSNYTTRFQVPLQIIKKDFRFSRIQNSIAVYDSYFEISPDIMYRLLNDDSRHSDSYTMDLHGTKELEKIRTQFVFTSRSCNKPIFSFGKQLKPLEMNIIEGVEGKEIFFCDKNSIREGRYSRLLKKQKDFFYYYRDLTRKRLMILFLLKLFRKI